MGPNAQPLHYIAKHSALFANLAMWAVFGAAVWLTWWTSYVVNTKQFETRNCLGFFTILWGLFVLASSIYYLWEWEEGNRG